MLRESLTTEETFATSWKLALRNIVLFGELFCCASLHADQGQGESGPFTVDTRYGFSDGAGVSGFFKVDTRLSGSAGDAVSGTFTVDTRGAAIGTITFTGRVMDSAGLGLRGATVTALQSSVVRARVSTDAGGYYTLPLLAPGAYELAASAPTTVQDRRVVRLSSATGRQDFLLRALPASVRTETVNNTPPAAYQPPPQSPNGIGTLKLFNGSQFTTNLTAIDRQKLTVVLTHGWLSSPAEWARGLAVKMGRLSVNDRSILDVANVFAWDWEAEAAIGSSAITYGLIPEYKTPDQGLLLGQTLYAQFGQGYTKPVHFIGHSLGTLVNRYAADFLHGEASGSQDYAPVPWLKEQTHLTLLDEAELARAATGAQDSLSLVTWLNRSIDYGAESQGWKSPIPFSHGWLDNYVSAYGLPHEAALNVCLNYAVIRYPPPPIPVVEVFVNVAAHGYAHEWYAATVARPGVSLGGFRHSPEFNALDPARSGSFPPTGNLGLDRYYRQPQDCFLPPCVLNEDEQLSLESIGWADFLECVAPALGGETRTQVNSRRILIEHGWDFGVDTLAETGRITGNAAVTVYQGTKWAAGVVYDNVATGAEATWNGVEDLGNAAGLRLNLLLQNLSPSGQRALPAGAPTTLWEHATLPLVVPTEAKLFAFDFSVTGDASAATLVFGLNETNLLTLPAKFLAPGTRQSSQLYDVATLAGRTNAFFFGVTGATSTNCTVTVENLRFFILQPPHLTAQPAGVEVVLSWPSAASGYFVESAGSVTATDWAALPQPPALFAGRFRVTNAPSGEARFFRLRRE